LALWALVFLYLPAGNNYTPVILHTVDKCCG
jgi:hypothetical protein